MSVGEGHHVREMRVGDGRTSARPSSPAVGDDDARMSGRGVVSGRGVMSGRSNA
jgi:hypothetical protein